MLHIECPWCGFRDDAEFHYGGEAHITRPNPSETWDEKFPNMFLRTIEGTILERWCHRSGCRRWFNVLRNTITNEILKFIPLPRHSLNKVKNMKKLAA